MKAHMILVTFSYINWKLVNTRSSSQRRKSKSISSASHFSFFQWDYLSLPRDPSLPTNKCLWVQGKAPRASQ